MLQKVATRQEDTLAKYRSPQSGQPITATNPPVTVTGVGLNNSEPQPIVPVNNGTSTQIPGTTVMHGLGIAGAWPVDTQPQYTLSPEDEQYTNDNNLRNDEVDVDKIQEYKKQGSQIPQQPQHYVNPELAIPVARAEAAKPVQGRQVYNQQTDRYESAIPDDQWYNSLDAKGRAMYAKQMKIHGDAEAARMFIDNKLETQRYSQAIKKNKKTNTSTPVKGVGLTNVDPSLAYAGTYQDPTEVSNSQKGNNTPKVVKQQNTGTDELTPPLQEYKEGEPEELLVDNKLS